MLDNLPHDQAFSQLIVGQMDTYALKCAGWYKALVSRSQPSASGRRLRAPAAWAEEQDMEDLLTRIIQSDQSNRDNYEQLIEQETKMLIQAVDTDPLEPADMVQDKKSVISLCLLYTSMKWLATKTAQLRHVSDRTTNSARAESVKERHTQRWTLLASSEPKVEGASVYLPLSQEVAA